MAGDFVMVQFATPRKPEVLRLAAALNVAPAHAFGLCVIAWMWFDEQSEDGHILGVTDVTLDAVVGHAGFSNGLRQVGWLHVRDNALQLPNFDRIMGESAKKRVKDAKRQQKRRHGDVTKLSQKKCDKSVTKEEKRREEKSNTPKPPSGASVSLPELPLILKTAEFKERLDQWLSYKGPKAYKPEGLSALISRAANVAKEHGLPHVLESMERAMANGWKGWDQDEKSPSKPAPAPPPPNQPVPKRIPPVSFK